MAARPESPPLYEPCGDVPRERVDVAIARYYQQDRLSPGKDSPATVVGSPDTFGEPNGMAGDRPFFAASTTTCASSLLPSLRRRRDQPAHVACDVRSRLPKRLRRRRLSAHRGVLRPVIPRPGHRLPKRILYERQRWFRQGRAWRARGRSPNLAPETLLRDETQPLPPATADSAAPWRWPGAKTRASATSARRSIWPRRGWVPFWSGRRVEDRRHRPRLAGRASLQAQAQCEARGAANDRACPRRVMPMTPLGSPDRQRLYTAFRLALIGRRVGPRRGTTLISSSAPKAAAARETESMVMVGFAKSSSE
jgi:hypothetical protein